MTQIPTSSQPPTGMGDRAEAAAATAKDEAGSIADTARDKAGEVASTAGQQAKAVVDDAKSHATQVMDKSRQQLMDQASEQTDKLAGTVREVSDQLRGVMQGGSPPQGIVADLTTQAADATSKLANHLEGRRPEELLDDVRRFARRRPGAFLLGAMGAGLIAGRLVRAVDTSQVVDAAKAGAGMDGQGNGQGNGAGRSGTAGMPPTRAMPAYGASGAPTQPFPRELTDAVRP